MNSPEEREPLAPRPGLRLPLDILIAPRHAFATIAATGEWLPSALIVVGVYVLVGSVLLAAATAHVAMLQPLAGASPVSFAERLQRARIEAPIFYITSLLFQWVWSGLILAVVSRQGPGGFGLYFAAAVNATLPIALEDLVAATIVAAHGAEHYHSFAGLVLALPDSLAMFRPGGGLQELGFLASFSLGTLWNALLLAYALVYIGGVRLLTALVTSFTLLLAFALLHTVLPG